MLDFILISLALSECWCEMKQFDLHNLIYDENTEMFENSYFIRY